ncbi:MAG: DUF721 domain-containing protein [Dissulfurispiraceae bacterium]
MQDTGSILACLFKNIGMEHRLTLACLQSEWTGLFDEPLSLHTCPANLNNGILTVNVDSPLWLQQLKFFKQAMLKKLNAYGITAIDFRHGRTNLSLFSRDGKQSGKSNCAQTAQPEKTLDDADVDWIEQTVAGVHDPLLQDRIRNVIEKALIRNL